MSLTTEELAELRKEYPVVGLMNDGKILLMREDRSSGVVIDKEILKMLAPSQGTVRCVESYLPGGDSDIFELVKKEGLEKEYCLIYGGKILFHSPSKEACNEHERSHPCLGFTRWGPMFEKS